MIPRFYPMDGWQASSMDEMIQKLKEYYWGEEFVGFVDSKGNASCYNADDAGRDYDYFFFCPEYFGSTYPRRYYSIIGGYIKEIFCEYEPVVESADWQIDGDIETSQCGLVTILILLITMQTTQRLRVLCYHKHCSMMITSGNI